MPSECVTNVAAGIPLGGSQEGRAVCLLQRALHVADGPGQRVASAGGFREELVTVNVPGSLCSFKEGVVHGVARVVSRTVDDTANVLVRLLTAT